MSTREMHGSSQIAAARSPGWLRPASAVGAVLIMSLVVVPTASLATHNPGHYNDNDSSGGAFAAVVAVGAVGGVAYYIDKKKKEKEKKEKEQQAVGQGS